MRRIKERIRGGGERGRGGAEESNDSLLVSQGVSMEEDRSDLVRGWQ